jgi:uncharacterized protein (UPF0332 family)
MKNTKTFKEKSEESLKAAQVLINKKLFNSSVHCSYYACVQLLNYILEYSEDSAVKTVKAQRPKKETEEDEKDETAKKGQDSHIFLITNFYKLLLGLKAVSQYGAYTANDFSKDMGNLRKYRTKADYKEVDISKEKAEECLQFAQTITNNLNQYYPI